jgi:antitoxin component YwqK of YwqJK toxin-antitoxin module
LNKYLKMRNLGSVFLIILLMVGCKSELKDEVVELHSNGTVKKLHYYTLKRGDKEVVKEVVFYSTGEKLMEGPIKNNKRNGQWNSWYENGKLWSEGNYIEDIRVEKTRVYYDNGQLRIDGQYDNGARTGLWSFYDEEGKLIQEVEFFADSIVNQEEFFYGIPYK